MASICGLDSSPRYEYLRACSFAILWIVGSKQFRISHTLADAPPTVSHLSWHPIVLDHFRTLTLRLYCHLLIHYILHATTSKSRPNLLQFQVLLDADHVVDLEDPRELEYLAAGGSGQQAQQSIPC